MRGFGGNAANLVDIAGSLARALPDTSLPTLALGAGTVAFLFWVRSRLRAMLVRLGVNARLADVAAKAGPVVGVAVTTAVTWRLDLAEAGVGAMVLAPMMALLMRRSMEGGAAVRWPRWAIAVWVVFAVGFPAVNFVPFLTPP